MGPSRIGRWKTAAQTNSRIRHGVSSSAHASQMHATLKHFCVDRFLFPRRTWKLVPSARYFTCASRYCAFTQRELKALPPLPFPLPFCCSQGERMRNGGGWAWQCVCIDSMRPRNEAQGFLVQAPLVFLPISLKKKGETERERDSYPALFSIDKNFDDGKCGSIVSSRVRIVYTIVWQGFN